MKLPNARYGDKRDYRKIDIYVGGDYVCSTTWASNRTIAKAKYLALHPEAKSVSTAYSH